MGGAEYRAPPAMERDVGVLGSASRLNLQLTRRIAAEHQEK